MATRLKTVFYYTPSYVDISINVTNALTGIDGVLLDIVLPESSKVFKSVVVNFYGVDKITATGGTLSTRTLSVKLAGATATTITNSNVIANSGENIAFMFGYDFTSHFQANWTGTSMACEINALVNQTTGTTTGIRQVFAEVEITYEYDDTSATQVKSVMIPLNAPLTGIAATATTYDTIPALNTYLPEASKTYMQQVVVIQGNTHGNTGASDISLNHNVGALTTAERIFEKALVTNNYFKITNRIIGSWPSHDATQDFQLWSPATGNLVFNHLQVYLVATYTFDASTTTSVMNSLMLPMEIDSPFGGPTAADYQRSTRDLWIQEPGTIVTNRVAFYCYWTQIVSMSGLNMRMGTGSFLVYTDAISVIAGNNACMVRNDSAFTLVRGKNTLNFDVYTTGTTSLGWNTSGFWIINYTSDVSPQGIGAHNHTVFRNILTFGTGVTESTKMSAAVDFQIPEAEYFITALGTRLTHMSSGAATPNGYTVQVERLVSEGGMAWENGYRDIQQSDPEVGIYTSYSQMRALFKRFPNDLGVDRVDLETARRWRYFSTLPAATSGSGWATLDLMVTYHSIGYEVSGDLSGGFSGTVDVDLWKSTGEKVRTLQRTDDGPFSFTWFDDTEPVFVTAKDASSFAKSKTDSPDDLFDISLAVGSDGPTYFAV